MFNRLDKFSYRMNPLLSPAIVQDAMARATSRSDVILAEFPKIGGKPTREGLIELYQLVSGNEASVSSNLGGGRHGHLAWTTTSKEYAAQTGFAFVPPHNPEKFPPNMGNAQEQVLGTDKF